MLMYHRFDENKYPSTNIQMEVFKKQIKIIEELKIEFLHPDKLNDTIVKPNLKKKVLLTVDDGFQSFYEKSWPFLKEKNIPLILFISTKDVGTNGYMTWSQIKEVEKSGLVVIGTHSHSHDYLIDKKNYEIINDLKQSIDIFKNKLGYSPEYFSYPFGEYSSDLKKIVRELNFKFAFGQHSGLSDITKDKLELPRFPINEKYGDLKRFRFILNLLPFQFKKILPENKYLEDKNNPPKIKVVFYEAQKNLNQIQCYSNDNNEWKKSEVSLNKNILYISIKNKFITERGRINCSLNDLLGWRWLGIQYVIKNH